MSAKPKVLVVEDEPLVREVIVIELEEAGYDVVAAESGEQAVSLFENPNGIDLLFTDIRLPGALNGWDVAEKIRSRQAALPVIYATGFSEHLNRRVPGSLFLNKPYRATAVIDAAKSLGVVAQ